ncbi:hypothetical protein CDL12_00319 [Handroanthus impetiginosus]|uniref:Pentacotripeptide-repeat region of PRORP domain-containing protein n=1 Tax=Handroanthus impetiginosus TaxID=429701 RepID=A0A2G9IAY5_9LAMI|nr:hypothetical protein CDL12_00319 [Handroanthus impetiginosus]
MKAAPHLPLYGSKFSTNFRTQLSKFKLSYSTSLFPPSLRHVFSETPKTSAAVQNAKHTITNEAQTMSRLINTKHWSARLEYCLSILTPLSQTAFFQSLRLIKNPSKALRVFNWARDSGLTNNHHSYFMMLEILGRARNLNRARNFLYSIPRKSNYAVPLTDNLFLILLKRSRTGLVFELYDEMPRTYGVKPDFKHGLNILIKCFCMNSKVDEAFRIFKEKERFDCKPDLVTYNTIVDGLCRAGKVKIAQNVVNGMLSKSEDLGQMLLLEIDEAMALFRNMVSSGIKPNKITFNTIIKALCESQKFDMIKEILWEYQCEDGEFVPDTCTFNTMMNAHCSQENLDEALKVFEKMKELNFLRDSATYSVLIRTLCQKGNFDKAEELLDELFNREILLRDDGCTPLSAAGNLIFEHLCTNGKTKKAERSLIEGLLRKQEPILANDTLLRMLRSSNLPRASTFHRILMALIEKGCAHESENLMIVMLDKEIRPNINVSTDVVRLLFRSSMETKAFQLVESLYENGYILNMEKLISFLCQDKKLSEACELLVFCLKNDQNLDIALCNTVAKAFNLYYELLEKGIQLPLSYLEELSNALEAEGKLKEAQFVAKRMRNS